jgi:uncharacterized protein (DUF1501 family)
MSPISRRQFLSGAAVLGGAAAVGGWKLLDAAGDDAGGDASTSGSPASTSARASGAAGTLVLVTLYGGNDALNTVVPIGDAGYAAQRGALALDPAQVHTLSDGFGLHPALAGCKALWDDDRLAVVHGVGFEHLDRSHFHCMDVWQAGSEDELATGWVGRWLDADGADPVAAVSVGRSLPLLMRGATRSAAVVPASAFELPGDARMRDQLAALTARDDDRSPLAAMVASSTADLLSVVDTVGPVLASGAAGDELEGDQLSDRLAAVATMIEADLPTRVYAVDLGGFDTHANQAATHAAFLTELDTALHDFATRVAHRPVSVAVYSEFGRRVAPNASGGTDHGRAGTILLVGNVRAGHHGDPPPLAALDDGDLATTVDYRAVLGGLLEDVVGIDAAEVLGKGPKPLRVG